MRNIDENSRLDTTALLRTSQINAKDSQFVRKGDLIFRARGQTNTASLVEEDIDSAIVAAPLLHVRTTQVNPEYLQWFLNLPRTQRQLAELAVGTALQLISKANFESICIPIPPAELQNKIVELAKLKRREQALLAKISELESRYLDAALMEAVRNSRK